MTSRLLVGVTLLAAAAAGAGVGALVSAAGDPGGQGRDVQSITGVSSGVDGSQAKQPEKKGIDQVALPPETPPEMPPEAPPAAPKAATAEIVTGDASMQSIRGIKGIDTVMLQNLEAVLRMQAPPLPPEEGGGGGGVRAAAALMMMQTEEQPEPEPQDDGREELIDPELEGS
jgi:hypothetical protein